jgi:hypothetical protein
MVLGVAAVTYGLVLTSPASGVTWYRGMPATITWASFHTEISGSNVRIDLLSSGSMVSVATAIIATPALPGSYVWLVPSSFPSGTYYVLLTSEYDSTATAMSGLVTVLSGALTVLQPLAGSQWPLLSPSTQLNISWLAFGSNVASSTVTVALRYCSGGCASDDGYFRGYARHVASCWH